MSTLIGADHPRSKQVGCHATNAVRSLIVRFGEFVLHLRSGERAQNGTRVLLPVQLFRVLALLVRQSGALVTREELHHELWRDDTFVDFEHSLNAAIKRLREALGDAAASPRFVETLPRRGYRFIAAVQAETASDRASTPPSATAPAEPVRCVIHASTWRHGGPFCSYHRPDCGLRRVLGPVPAC